MAGGVRLTRSRDGRVVWAALAALLALGALAGALAPHDALDWQPARAATEPWRWWSAAFVHWSALHLGANLLGTLVVAAFGIAAGVPHRAALCWFVAWPLTHLALWLQPELTRYGGLSGVLHAGVAVTAWWLTRDPAPRARFVGFAVLAGLALKLVLEAPWAGPLRTVPGWDIAIAPFAHLTGTLAGVACAAAGLRARAYDRAP